MLSFKVMKKIILSLLATVFIFASIAPKTANAQWYNQDPIQWYKHVYDDSNPSEIFGERYTAAQVDWIIMSFLTWPATKFASPEATSCLLEAAFGDENAIDTDTCVKGLSQIKDAFDQLGNVKNTLTSDTSIDTDKPTPHQFAQYVLKERPISGISYVKQSLSKLNPVRTTSAQSAGFGYAQSAGFGYAQMGGLVRNLWASVRNFSYALFVIVAIILSFMIMFRVKTSPQTVISIQSALPKLALTLVLVTFSYAIAGFLIDLMYVIIGVVALFFEGAFPTTILGYDHSMFEVLTTGLFGAGFLFMLLFDVIGYPLALFLGLVALPNTGLGITNLASSSLLTIVGFVLGLVLMIVMIIVVVFMWFKITWLLLKTTATLLLLIIFGPLQITAGTVMSSVGFETWVKNIASQLAVFPLVGSLFSLSFLFLNESIKQSLDSLNNTSWAQTLGGVPSHSAIGTISFGDGWPPLLAGAGNIGPLILMGISLTVLFIIPKAADMIKSVLSGRPFGYGMAVGEALGPANTAAYGGINYVSSKQQTGYAEAVKGLAPGQSLSPRTKRAQSIGSFIRGASGGKIK